MKAGHSLVDGFKVFQNPTNRIQDNLTAQCCRAFYLPKSPEEILEDYENFLAGLPPTILQIDRIAPMLVYLGYLPSPDQSPDAEPNGHYYACLNLDRETGQCKIYADRPRMCSGFPDYLKADPQYHQTNLTYCDKCSTKPTCNAFQFESKNE